jgi:hypothetical protein
VAGGVESEKNRKNGQFTKNLRVFIIRQVSSVFKMLVGLPGDGFRSILKFDPGSHRRCEFKFRWYQILDVENVSICPKFS